MSADYTGLHGRSPHDRGHTWADADGRVAHHVPEGWEDLNLGICPGCGRVVGWDPDQERWNPTPDGVVLVMLDSDVELLLKFLQQDTDPEESRQVQGPIEEMIVRELDLNRPLEE